MSRLFLFFLLMVITSCTSEVIRPKLTGIIVDEQGKPVNNCKVGETLTDKNGKFELLELTRNVFIIKLGYVPVFIREDIKKKGYEDRILKARLGRGGVSVGSVLDMGTIRLRKNIVDFSQIDLQGVWLASTTKKLDTLFITKKNVEYDEGKIDVIANRQNTYSTGYYYGIDNLPDNVFERHIELDLTDSILDVQRVLIYGNPKTSEKTQYDTIYTQGEWKIENQLFQFKTNLVEINGFYEVDDFNYDSMVLIKNSCGIKHK